METLNFESVISKYGDVELHFNRAERHSDGLGHRFVFAGRANDGTHIEARAGGSAGVLSRAVFMPTMPLRDLHADWVGVTPVGSGVQHGVSNHVLMR